MRPRGITRGNLTSANPSNSERLASMRPRGITRGNVHCIAFVMAGAAGFNEAAGYYPRKPPCRNRHRHFHRKCFNEAAGYYPRKQATLAAQGSLPVSCFNEAAGYYPRKPKPEKITCAACWRLQ